jgi:hypothetical protein
MSDIIIKSERGHYVLYQDGQFLESADSYREAEEDRRAIEAAEEG